MDKRRQRLATEMDSSRPATGCHSLLRGKHTISDRKHVSPVLGACIFVPNVNVCFFNFFFF